MNLGSPKNSNAPIIRLLCLTGLFAIFFLLPQPAFSAAISASSQISFYGGNDTVDSYDSADPLKSTDGLYDPAKAGDEGNIILNSGLFTLTGHGRVYGHVDTGPYGILTLGTNAGIGSHAWFTTNSGIEPGYVSSLTNGSFAFPVVTLPDYSGFTPVPTYSADDPRGNVLIFISAGTNVTFMNSSNPPPSPEPGQTITASTNAYYITSSSYPGDQPGLTTNITVRVQTNRTVTMTASNLICSTTVFSGNSLPASGVCSYTTGGLGNGAKTYRWTVIVGTNVTYTTNISYDYTTNSTYTYQHISYNYTIYAPTIYETNHYDHIICGNSYCLGSLSGKTLVSCPSCLVMPNGFSMSSGDQITIGPSGSLTLYVGGSSACSLNGNGIINKPGLPWNFILACASDVQSLSLNLSTSFTGVVVAPAADIGVNTGGSQPQDFSGTLIGHSIAVNGNVHFHLDESLNLLQWYPLPHILVQPTNQVAASGTNVTFTVVASGDNLRYQWCRNLIPILDATNASLTLTNVQTGDSTLTNEMGEPLPGDSGWYRVTVSNDVGPVDSWPAMLSVYTTPAAFLDISSLPVGNQFHFNLAGVPGFTYVVEGSTNLLDWTPLVTNVSPFTFTETNQSDFDHRYYRAVYSSP